MAPGRIVVVVNGEGGLDDPELEKAVHVVRLAENLGPAGGFREGMRAAATLGDVDWFYLCEDDVGLFDLPTPRVARLVDAAEERVRRGERVGAVVAYGRDLHPRTGHTSIHEVGGARGYEHVDAASWGASLVARAVIEHGVLPSDDYFFGYEDFDFWYQLRRAGFEMLLDCTSAAQVAPQMSDAGRDGAFAGERPNDHDEPWRAFYVARNYFLLARRHGSADWIAAHLAYSARRLQLAGSAEARRAILHGLLAGALGRTGKDPRYLRGRGELQPANSSGSGAAGEPTSKRRILHVLPRDVARGAQVFVRDLVHELSGGENEHLVLTLFASPPAVLSGSRSLNVPMGAMRDAGFDPRVLLRLRRTLAELRPDVVVAHGGESLKYLALLRRRATPLAYLAIGIVTPAARHGLRRELYRALLARCDVVAGVSQATLDEATGLFGVPEEKKVLLPNGRDANRYRPPIETTARNELTLLFVGHLTATKRPDRFIAALRELRARGYAVRGLIAGDGPLRATLEQAAATAGVALLGRRDDVPELLRAADLFVFCSVPESEGMPGVLIEAALSGLPIVSTEVPGAADVVEAGVSGVIVAPDDHDALVGALEALVREPTLRRSMGAAARRRGEERFDLASVAARWDRFLEELAPSRSGLQADADGRALGRPRVLHLIKSLTLVGGAEQLLLSVTTAEAGTGHFEYHVAHVLGGASPDFVAKLSEAGVAVHDIGMASHYDLRWMWRLRRLLTSLEIDVLHLHLPYAASLGRLVARSIPGGPRVVHTQHNIWQHNVPFVRALHRATYRLDDADIAVSQAAWEAIPPPLRRRTEVLVHGLDLEDLVDSDTVREEVRAEFGVEADTVLITIVANLRREKGYDVLLDAAARLVRAGLPVHFVAVGSGPLEEETRRARDDLGLAEHFTMTGFREDAKRIVAGSDLFVLASHHEGFPVAVMEALALGVPVVSTAVGDVPRVVQEAGCGIIVPPGDPAALAAAISSFVEDSPKRAAAAAAAFAAGRQFDIRRTADRLEQIYTRVLTTRRVRARLRPGTRPASSGT
jgi:glycosyltransferase involved in cell wall biosynthesis